MSHCPHIDKKVTSNGDMIYCFERSPSKAGSPGDSLRQMAAFGGLLLWGVFEKILHVQLISDIDR